MTHRVRSAFNRFFALGVASVIAVVCAVSPAAAQQTSGKIQGTVTNQAGEPVAKAQVIVVGTAFGAVTDDKGYYFINNLPAGNYTIRAQFIGYAPTEQPGSRVLGGQTITFNFKMLPSAVVVGGINVVAAANPIVPRDEVTSKSIVSGEQFNTLPVDNARSVITLQPGVVESNNGLGVSIRGGRPGEANVYIDGAPVRASNSGGQAIGVQTNGIEEASVTTGALGVEFGDAQSGLISFTTKSGGTSLAGALSAQTDGATGAASAGWNRYEGSLGGPVPGIQNLRFFLSGVLQGQVSNFRGLGAADQPSYAVAGIDTTVTVNTGTGTQLVPLPRFVQYSGSCDASQNDGIACQGARLPDAWTTNVNLQGKLSYFYGSGSSIALTGLATGQQFRNWPGTNIDDPTAFTGNHNWQRDAILNWQHSVFKAADRALSLSLNLSYGTNYTIAGPLDPSSELSSRDPLGGIEMNSLQFNSALGSFGSGFFNNPDQVVRDVRTNDIAGFLPLNGPTQGGNVIQSGRINAFGMITGGFGTSGLGDPTSTLSSEKRIHGRFQVDWQANRYHRFNFGGELQQSDVAYWNSGINNPSFMDVYHDKPIMGAAWASDRLDLGDVVIELGLRYDRYNSEALFSNTPGFTFSDPGWNVAASPVASGNDTAYTNSLARVFTPGVWHNAVSPRIQVSFPITDQTDFRLSYSHQVQSPNLTNLLSGINTDLTNTNSNDSFGRDVGFGKSILFEFGVRHAFSPDLVLDMSAYNKNKTSDLSFRQPTFDDPSNPGRTLHINVLTDADFGYDRGVDVKLDRRLGNWLAASVAYTYEVAAGTGSDPNTYLNTNARSISGVTGTVLPPAEQARAVNDQRTHNIVGSVSLSVPQGWQQGSALGNIFKDVRAFVTFRVLSGLPYTPLENTGGGATVSATSPGTNFGLTASQAGDINSASTPWTKYLDLRLDKGLKLGRLDVTAFADIRNLFNWKNITGLFAETNDVYNAVFQSKAIGAEYTQLATEASSNGALRSDGAVTVTNCGSWAGTGVVDCVELARAEARFGNGNGVYTVAEQTNALNTYYNLFNGPYTFYDQPRDVRLGFEVSF